MAVGTILIGLVTSLIASAISAVLYPFFVSLLIGFSLGALIIMAIVAYMLLPALRNEGSSKDLGRASN